MQDMVITAMSGYGVNQVRCWMNSLERTGFTGRVVIIAFNISDKTITELQSRNVEVVLASSRRNSQNDGYLYADGFGYQVPAARHYFYWAYLLTVKDVRYVISTDVDVIFQLDPSTWLSENMGDKKLNYGCEALRYQDEEWGNDNMLHCYGPHIHAYIKNNPIYNAGSMAGELSTFRDFSLNVHLAIQHVQNPTPDQAGVNLLLSIEPYKSITKFNDHDGTWACQAGTTANPEKIGRFRPRLLSPEPRFDGTHVYNSKGEKYVLVHQYNKVPEWQKRIEEIYG